MKPLNSILRSPRLWGLAGTALVLYFVVFVVLGKLDMSWIMPDTNQIARTFIEVWPRMPFFAVQKESSADGQGQVIYYTVPTRQLTPQEIARMGMTNEAVHPAAPR
ncbi:MAG TPA: hypothetical protein VGC39_06920 [Candidatus Methylacidiphilales bacterium]